MAAGSVLGDGDDDAPVVLAPLAVVFETTGENWP